MFDWSRNFFLLKLLFYLRRLRWLFPGRDTRAESARMLRGEFYERLWESAAAEVGAQFKKLGHRICELSRDGLVTRVQQNCTAIDDFVTMTIALNKTLVYRLLAEAGLPIPRHVEFTLRTLSRAAAFLDQVPGGCVLKPANGTGGGQGVTTGIRSRRQLAWAATWAAQAGAELLLEEQIAGDNYRLLYLDGVLLDAIQRRAPSVTGDGRSTVRGLVEEENLARLKRGASVSQVVLTVDQDMRNTLARQGLSLSSVPAAGAVIPVKTVINQNFAADNVTVNGRLCPEVVADGARAARCLGVRLAGIDIITRDPTRALGETGGVIIEVNTTPGFHYHYHKNDGSYPVAVRVLEQLFSDLHHRTAVETEPWEKTSTGYPCEP
jgi:cyanophycin synthetase